MKSYQDGNTLWHDRPSKDGKPSSNNPWIYTAYSKYLVEPASKEDKIKRGRVHLKCIVALEPIKLNRLPSLVTPPFSKDEAIGVVSNGYAKASEFEEAHWNICNFADYTPEKLTLRKAFKAARILWKIRKEHRNHMWQNKLEDAYCLAFWLPWWDQYYMKKFCGEDPTLLQTIFFYLNAINVLTKGGKSARMLLWLQCKDLNHWMLKFINQKKWIENYFEEGHPFREKV